VCAIERQLTKEKAKYIAVKVHAEFTSLSQENVKSLATGP